MSIARWMKKAAVIPICIGILLSHKKEHIRVTSIELDEPRVCYTEWSKWEREKQILYINGCIRNLEKRYWWTCFQGRNRDTDIENRLWTQQGKEREGQIERAALTYIHVCVCACMHVHGCVCACMRVRACVCAAQSCLTLYRPMDCNLPGSVHGILQARILGWVAIPFSRGVFPTWGLNPGLLRGRQLRPHLSPQGGPTYAHYQVWNA